MRARSTTCAGMLADRRARAGRRPALAACGAPGGRARSARRARDQLRRPRPHWLFDEAAREPSRRRRSRLRTGTPRRSAPARERSRRPSSSSAPRPTRARSYASPFSETLAELEEVSPAGRSPTSRPARRSPGSARTSRYSSATRLAALRPPRTVTGRHGRPPGRHAVRLWRAASLAAVSTATSSRRHPPACVHWRCSRTSTSPGLEADVHAQRALSLGRRGRDTGPRSPPSRRGAGAAAPAPEDPRSPRTWTQCSCCGPPALWLERWDEYLALIDVGLRAAHEHGVPRAPEPLLSNRAEITGRARPPGGRTSRQHRGARHRAERRRCKRSAWRCAARALLRWRGSDRGRCRC